MAAFYSNMLESVSAQVLLQSCHTLLCPYPEPKTQQSGAMDDCSETPNAHFELACPDLLSPSAKLINSPSADQQIRAQLWDNMGNALTWTVISTIY